MKERGGGPSSTAANQSTIIALLGANAPANFTKLDKLWYVMHIVNAMK